jgi:uncharacterized protein
MKEKQPNKTPKPKGIAFIAIIISFAILAVNPAYRFLINKPFNQLDQSSQIFMLIYSIFWMFVVPMVIIKCIYKMKLKDFGLKLPTNMKKAFYLVIFSYLMITPPFIWFAKRVQAYYQVSSLTYNEFLFALFIILPLYYFAEEFFFRGFIFIKLWDDMRWRSVWFTEILFALIHIGKPSLEIIFSIPVGLILNYVTYNSRSIFPAILIHYYMGAFMIICSFFGLYKI